MTRTILSKADQAMIQKAQAFTNRPITEIMAECGYDRTSTAYAYLTGTLQGILTILMLTSDKE